MLSKSIQLSSCNKTFTFIAYICCGAASAMPNSATSRTGPAVDEEIMRT